ncbi:histidine phosphatase family protein [Paenibacillus agricola]|uniref:Histidine phosphatase family protein n=1 Tax=Paenibacillus agricola TaxID=2716264 RepID=A0ABX0JAB9_9BACL|nr:histidine phosphatase family protein [Paenibacillus agricola]NHN33395.1 histidine phosphatase family protein [Paenibacillus agricola]
MQTTIYMVRHAESPFTFGQERERGLSPEGFVEAKRVAQLFTDIDVHYIVSSPYARAQQTIQHIAEQKSLPIIEFEELAERSIMGLNHIAAWDVLYEAIRQSFDDKDFALEGGETTRSAQQRAVPILEKLLEEQRGNTVVIGTHGNMMTIIMNHYDPSYGFDFWNTTSKPDIYRMTFSQNRLEQVERIWE